MQNEIPNVKKIYGVEEDRVQSQLRKQIKPEDALKLKNYLCKKNKYAARAFMQFPSDHDKDMILEKGWGHSQSFQRYSVDEVMVDQISFSDYLSGKQVSPLTDHVTCIMIE